MVAFTRFTRFRIYMQLKAFALNVYSVVVPSGSNISL